MPPWMFYVCVYHNTPTLLIKFILPCSISLFLCFCECYICEYRKSWIFFSAELLPKTLKPHIILNTKMNNRATEIVYCARISFFSPQTITETILVYVFFFVFFFTHSNVSGTGFVHKPFFYGCHQGKSKQAGKQTDTFYSIMEIPIFAYTLDSAEIL